MKKLSIYQIFFTIALALLLGCGGNETYNPTVIGGGGGLIAYAGHGYSDDVDVIDVDSMTVTATIVGAGGYRMVLSPDGLTLYSTGGGSLVYVSSTVTNTLTTSFDPSASFGSITSSELEAIAINPAGTRLYVFDESGDTAMFVIDTATNTVLSATSLALYEPENAVVSSDGAFVYVVDNDDIAKISTASLTIVASVDVGSDAHGVALNAAGTMVYAKGAEGGIDAYDADTLAFIETIPAANDGYYLDNRPGSSRLYAVNESSTLSVINSTTNALISDVALSSGGAAGVIEVPDGSQVLVAKNGGLAKLDATTFVELGATTGSSYQSVVVK